MIRLFDLFVEQGLGPPSVKEFVWFYSVKSNKDDDGFYYFSKRPAKGLHTVVQIKDNMGSWKESYFYAPEVQVRGSFSRMGKYLPRISLGLVHL